ncbi:MAG: asparaginase [Propionibacteriaceae bacterium]|jgi:L-asparaginase|nr:asparaginase [Propionibacteriaceae bacterium]
MAHIVVVGTGGTIASRSDQKCDGKVAVDTIQTLIDPVKSSRLPPGVTITAKDAGLMNSYNLTLGNIRHIGEFVRLILKAHDVDGVVVTHGTDTLEEVAFFCDLISDDPRPVVFTGAQRSIDTLGSDESGNIADAIAVAAAPSSRGRGVLVAFGGEVFAARGLRKVDTFNAQPFAPVVGGPIGLVHDRFVHYFTRPEEWHRVPMVDEKFDSRRIATVINQPGLSDGDSNVVAAVARGIDGLIILGTGAGNTSKSMLGGIKAAMTVGIPVLLSSRLPFGYITPTYGNGGAIDAVALGAVPVWSVPFTQARLLLATLLNRDKREQVVADLAHFDGRGGRWSPSRL